MHDIAKFVGFMQFYSHFIPHFEVQITLLHGILRKDYSSTLSLLWSKEAKAVFDKMRQAILDNPCLQRYNHCKLLVLCMDFSAKGFGYVACQPADDNVSLQAMHQCMQGGSFDFMTKDSAALLHPVAFGCRCTHGNKKRLHSHLGKAFSGDYAINKCCHMAFGQQFVWVTDCNALKFILSYNSWNPAILHLQMRFMCWDMIIKHRNDVCLTNTNYFSWLGADLCFDPLLTDYIQHIDAIWCRSPMPTEIPIAPEHQPYFCGPRINMPCKAILQQPPTSAPVAEPMLGLQHLSHWPVGFRTHAPNAVQHNPTAPSLYNSELIHAARMLAHFD
jgi:hypothetical protein